MRGVINVHIDVRVERGPHKGGDSRVFSEGTHQGIQAKVQIGFEYDSWLMHVSVKHVFVTKAVEAALTSALTLHSRII